MPIRLTGMSSGLDTEALVSELVSAYRKKSEKYTKAQTKLGWKQDTWKTTNSKIYSFYTGMADMRFSKAYNLKKTSVSDATKASITASSNAINGTQSLHITSVAKSGYLTGGQLDTTDGEKAADSTKLSSLKGFKSGTVLVNGKEVNLTDDMTVSDAVTKLKGMGVNASFDSTNQRIFVSAKESGKANDFTLTGKDANGNEALKALGLYTGSSTQSEKAQALRPFASLSDTDLQAQFDKYNANANIVKNAAAAQNNITRVNDYKKALETKNAADEKLKTLGADKDKIQSLIDDDKAFVSSDGRVFRAGKDADGKELFYDVNDPGALDEDGVVKRGLYVKSYQVEIPGEGEDAEPTKETKFYLSPTSGEGSEADAEDAVNSIKVDKATDFVKSQIGVDVATYKNATSTIEKFEADVETETNEGTGMTGNMSDYSLASLKDSLDAGTFDAATLKGDVESARAAANSENKTDLAAIASYAQEYEKEPSSFDQIKTDLQFAATEPDASEYSKGAVRVNGSDATIYLNGAKFTSNSNTFNINGLTIDALATTTTNADDIAKLEAGKADEVAGSVSITTTTDAQGVYDKIKDFLQNYNSLINELTSRFNADGAKGYEPLTSEEKDAMSDSDVEKWENKIKDSLLRRDSTLNGVITAMTTAMSSQFTIGDRKMTLASLGIQTLGYGNAEKNQHNAYHIYGDADDTDVSSKEDKLMKMINEDPDTVTAFFQELTGKLYTELGKKMSATTLSSTNTVYNDKEMGKEYSAYNTTIATWEDKLKDIEDKYYKQFSKMEKAMTELQGKTQQLSGLMG